MKHSAAFVLFFFCSSLLSLAVCSQDFSSLDGDLQRLENLITDTLLNTETQRKQLADLQKNLDESANIIAGYEHITKEQEISLRDLQTRLSAMSETYRTQSALSEKYERSSRFWKTFTLIAVPVTALLSGGIVWAVK